MSQSAPSHDTSASLLLRLRRPDDSAAWTRFAALYSPLLFFWARRTGLQPADAADLVQEVLVVLVRALPSFAYQPGRTFRGWLRTVLVNKWREQHRRKLPPAQAGVDLDALPDPGFDQSLSESDFRAELVRRAVELLRDEFAPATWEAFEQTYMQGRPVAETAQALGMSVNAVYVARSRVLGRLRSELEGMLDGPPT